MLVSLDGAVQRGDAYGPNLLVLFLRELGVPAALFDPTTQQLRGAGSARPSYVIAPNSTAATAARRLLEGDGLTMRTQERKTQRTD